jgi:curved DNA-binding protein
MEYRDYYKVLGVSKEASSDEIKKKYRRLARKYHPDVSKEKNAEEKFKEVQEAYEVLKDPAKRKAYDQIGSQPHGRSGFTPPPGWEFRREEFTGENPFAETGGFSDFFESLFGRRATREQTRSTFQQRGEDQHSKISISIEEAFSGTQRMIQLQEPQLNSTSGQVEIKTRSLNVKIPAGVVAGQQIRLSGQGSAGFGKGARGDLYLEIQLLDHPFYTVKERDVYLNCPITPWEAALGAKIKVPTLGGEVELRIPEASQTGKKLRLKGRGFPGSPPGDQYVILNIYTPPPHSESQQQIYKNMALEMGGFNPREIFNHRG